MIRMWGMGFCDAWTPTAGPERVSGKFRGLVWGLWSPQPCENLAGLPQNGRGVGNQDEMVSRLGVTSQLCSPLAVMTWKSH